ncbi:MAG: adenylate/guanylate cyclase domain-containing protein, partial [Mariprofundus sp.]
MSKQQHLPPMQMFLPSETVEIVKQYGSEIPAELAFEQEMTILFSDMRGFTELAESYRPRDVYATINASLAIQARAVHAHGGSVNKFLGDGLLACFSGPGMRERAIECMLELLDELPAREGELLPCKVGFGLHCGHVLFGLLGDENRREFTVIGAVANTAARLCGLAQPFQALVTESGVAGISEPMRASHCFHLRAQQFKGK